MLTIQHALYGRRMRVEGVCSQAEPSLPVPTQQELCNTRHPRGIALALGRTVYDPR